LARKHVKESHEFLPNSERYRPRTLAEVVGQGAIVPILQRFVDQFQAGTPTMPHLLFTGSPGCGKTSAACALGQDLFGEDWRIFFLELNASDERGIGVVRDTIKGYATKIPMGQPFNIVLLDEADNMTNDAQMALKRVIEKNVPVCRFILTANEENAIPEAIRDRLVRLPFRPVAEADAIPLLERAARDGGAQPTREGLVALFELCNRSMRSSLDTLQALGPEFDLGLIPKNENPAPEIVKLAMTWKAEEAEKIALKWIREGATVSKVFTSLFEAAIAAKWNPWRLGEYERAVRSGANFELQVRCFIWEMSEREVSENGVQG